MLLTPLSARAIIFNSTGDPNYNITAPGGALAGSGWQYTGDWAGGFTGTPVAPQYFLSAKHIGGTLGGGFVYNGVSYTTTAVTNIADTDLRLWKIDGTFPTFAPMWSSSDGSELNALNGNFVGVGRGTQRGAEIFHQTSGQFKGWAWGVRDFVQRWGENKTSGFLDWSATGDQKIITFNFDASGSGNAGANEFALSTGDSGGGAYLRVNGTGPWKLIGIMSGVSGPYSYNNTTNDPNDPHFSAALIDRGGYWDWTFQNKPAVRHRPADERSQLWDPLADFQQPEPDQRSDDRGAGVERGCGGKLVHGQQLVEGHRAQRRRRRGDPGQCDHAAAHRDPEFIRHPGYADVR
jgi:hypothetical protein